MMASQLLTKLCLDTKPLHFHQNWSLIWGEGAWTKMKLLLFGITGRTYDTAPKHIVAVHSSPL